MLKIDFSALALKIFPALVCMMAICSCSSSAAITIDTILVGDAGNPNDPATGNLYGGVSYEYRIGKYEVTVGQYTAFLNAIAATDTYGLYDHLAGGPRPIARGGSSGNYFYTIIGSPNLPIKLAAWDIIHRFANWMHNGQPIGMQDTSTTEDGAYTLKGATYPAIFTVTRNPGAKWFIPSENEWYKAAYYQPAEKGGDADSFWKYPMRTNDAPFSDQPPGATPDNARVGNFYKSDGVANGYDDGYAIPGCPSNCLTDVGAYTSAPSYYGTFDQGGNAWEMTETRISVSGAFVERGGSWAVGIDALGPTYRSIPTTPGVHAIGFRVATIVPEPDSLVLIIAAGLHISILRRQRK